VILDDVRDQLEEPRHAATRDLGIRAGNEGSGADEIYEERGCQLAFDTESVPERELRALAVLFRARQARLRFCVEASG
jgi:hypothetical protein